MDTIELNFCLMVFIFYNCVMTRQIFLTGIVDDWMAEDMRWALTNTSEKVIDIYISSWGGSVNKGFEIANLIQGIQASGKKEIHTYNLSHADSIATVMFLAAIKENRHIVDSSTLFTHDPRFMICDEVTKQDAEKMSAELEMQKNRIADFYVKNIEGLDKDEAISLMANETNLNAERMLELGMVSEVMPSFEIAAQKNLILNQIDKNMGLFNKKEPINALAMKEGQPLLYEGELKKGTKVQRAGEIVDLAGEYSDAEGNVVVIGEDNEVLEIKLKEVETVEDENSEAVVDQVAKILVDFETKIDAKLEAMKKTGSVAKVPKVDKPAKVVDSTQASASKGVQARMAEIAEKKQKNQETI